MGGGCGSCLESVLVYRVVVSLAPPRPGRGGVLRSYPPHWWRSFTTVTQIPQKPTHSSLFLALAGPFVFWGIWKKTEIRIEQRAVEWVFGIWGFLRGELDRRAAT